VTIHFDIPSEVESSLRRTHSDLNHAAKEAFLVDLYRRGELTHHQLAAALGLERYEVDGILRQHGISYELTREELDRQLQSLRPGPAQ